MSCLHFPKSRTNNSVGITQHTQRGHIARATFEAACYQTKAILDAMEMDSGHKLSDLAVDGGMSNSDICMQARPFPSPSQPYIPSNRKTKQTQADLIQIPVERPAMHETTALGAAIAAGFAIDIWKDFSELRNMNRANRTIFVPKISANESQKMYKTWSKAVEMSRGWLDPTEDMDAKECA